MSTKFYFSNVSLQQVFLLVFLATLSFFAGLRGFSSNGSKLSIKDSSLQSSRDCVWENRTVPTIAVSGEATLELDFEAHHFIPLPEPLPDQVSLFPVCPKNFSEYCPCQDTFRTSLFTKESFLHLERHCPGNPGYKHKCLIPKPTGYKKTFRWPKSKDTAWYGNVPSKTLLETKKTQNWVKLKGKLLLFPGGGTTFPNGVKRYVQEIGRVLPLKSGSIRTALDVGCGVASFGAFLFNYDILTMSIAPKDQHQAQVQFALERGLPAMLEVLGTYRLSYPASSFDMAHCSRCLVNWAGYDRIYLMEIDRVLRSGAYFILSGPPINWKVRYRGWNRTLDDLKAEKWRLDDLAKRLCWKKISEKGDIAIWQKPYNHVHCKQKLKTWKSPKLCADNDPDGGWYKKLTPCLTPLLDVADVHDVAGGTIEKWPKRLNSIPPKLKNHADSFLKDNREWNHRISYYEKILPSLSGDRFRNIMDMNAGFGGFAAAMNRFPVWTMNVVPPNSKHNLSIVYDRGLIGTYMNWCEAFSTYPRTYDLLHVYGVFSMYMNRCDLTDILLEMYRIVRPDGAIIIRDHIDIIVKVKKIAERMRWVGRVLHSEKADLKDPTHRH